MARSRDEKLAQMTEREFLQLCEKNPDAVREALCAMVDRVIDAKGIDWRTVIRQETLH